MTEFRAVGRLGNDVWVRLDKTSRALPNGNLVLVLHDVTAAVCLRQEKQARLLAEALAQRFKRACAFLSHEIRNMLFPQSVALEHMRETMVLWTTGTDTGNGGDDDDDDASSKRVLDAMKTAAPAWLANIDMILGANKTVSSILNKVLDLAKWNSGEFVVHKKHFPLLDLYRSVAAYAKAKGVAVQGIDDVDASMFVEADVHILKQACTNLVSNAVKFADGTPVVLRFAYDRKRLVVTVQDGGRGMTGPELEHVMVPFGQIRKAGAQETGTGMGLPLAKEMIETGHGGSLTLASGGPGKGTTATIRLALRCVERPRATPPDDLEVVLHDATADKDVLIVDDVPMNRRVLVFTAKRFGLTYDEAADGVEAVAKMAATRYSLVSMDMEMPTMNGDEAAEQARANGYRGIIIVVSGNTFQPCEKEALRRRGVTAFMAKLGKPNMRDAMKRLMGLKKGEEGGGK